MLPPSSGSKNKPTRTQHEAGRKQGFTCFLLHVHFLLGLFLDPEDVGDMFLRSVSWFSADYIAVYPKTHLSENFKSYNTLLINAQFIIIIIIICGVGLSP
jgi:hypothetical protein